MKKNGFTLVELLAVIVILGILVLIATPAVTSLMTKSTTNSFKNEALSFTSDLDRAFEEKMGSRIKTIPSTQSTLTSSELNASIYKVTISGTSYKYLCMTLKDLIDQQYTKKNLGNTYGGYVQMWVPEGTGETITFVNITNGRYYVQGRTSVLSGSDYSPSQTAATGVTVPTSTTNCPNAYTIPTIS